MPQYGLEFSYNFIKWYAPFRSKTDNHSHLELPKIVNVSLINGKAKFTLCSLLFKNLKSAMILFKLGFFLAINIMGEIYGEIPFFKIPYISLSTIGLSCPLT